MTKSAGEQIQMTRGDVRKLIAKAGQRYRGESTQFRFGFISALHTIVEHDGKENDCDCFPDEASLIEFFKLLGAGWKKEWKS